MSSSLVGPEAVDRFGDDAHELLFEKVVRPDDSLFVEETLDAETDALVVEREIDRVLVDRSTKFT